MTKRRAAVNSKTEQRVSDILRIAREVFSELGYASATTMEMARRLGVSEATVFTYFSGKRDLCVRVIRDWYDEIIAQVEGKLPLITGTQLRVEFLVRTHLYRLTIDGPGLCALILSEGRARDDTFGDEIVELQRRYTAPMMRVLSEGMEAGDIRNDMPLGLLRSSIYGPMEHVLWDAIHKQAIDVEAVTTRLMTFIWQALQPPNPHTDALVRLQGKLSVALNAYKHDLESAR